MRAPLVNGMMPAGDPNEQKLYERMNRAKIAPQGICLLSPTGQVLEWVETFEDDASVLAFLDHGLERNRQSDPANGPLFAERYMRYPGGKMEEVPSDDTSPIEGSHKEGTKCPALSLSHTCGPKGSVVCRIYGRALDTEGNLSGDTVRQENYVHDEFLLDEAWQAELLRALSTKGDEEVKLPDQVARLFALNAYLGHIDVRPLDSPRQGKGEAKECAFHARKEHDGLWRIEGKTDVSGEGSGEGGDGAGYRHSVRLEWRGFVEVDGGRVTRLLLTAQGTESLQWRSGGGPGSMEGNASETASLPAGRPIDLSCKVKYGVIGEPIRDDQVGEPPAGGPPPALPAKMHRLQQLMQEWQQKGKDPSAVGRIMERFEPLMRQQKFSDAEKVLDEAIQLLEGGGPSK